MAGYSEKEILDSIRKGADTKVFMYLYEKVFPKVKAYVLKNGGDLEESKDIFQDALLVFCSKVKSDAYVHQTEIDGFIYAVSRNMWINRLKVKNRKSSLSLEDLEVKSDVDVERVMILKEQKRSITEVLSQLGEVCKELLLYSSYHKLSMSEICQKMGFANENVAKTKNYKCKQRFIQLVDHKTELSELLR
jgi:RNA polymerase sigma factor (sigma-70 family)